MRVTFAPDGEGTRVELAHTGWEAYGDEAGKSCGSYNEGWDIVLGRYTRAAANEL